MARFPNLKRHRARLDNLFGLTFKLAPLAADEVEGVSVARDDVLSSITGRTSKDDHFRFGHYFQNAEES